MATEPSTKQMLRWGKDRLVKEVCRLRLQNRINEQTINKRSGIVAPPPPGPGITRDDLNNVTRSIDHDIERLSVRLSALEQRQPKKVTPWWQRIW